MKRARSIVLTAFLAMSSTPALAQRGFIGAGSTVQGDYLRGVGIEAWGLGQYNLNTAMGYSITVDANIRSDSYIASVLRDERDNWRKLDAQREAKAKANFGAIRERIRENPERLDVFTGNALNAALDQLNDTRIQEASLRSAPVNIPREMIRRIPFKLDEKGLIFSLQRLTARGKGKWPVAFQDDRFARECRAYDKAIDHALEQMIDGKVEPETIKEYDSAVADLSRKLEDVYGQSGGDVRYREAKARINEMERARNLLRVQKIQPIMADLDRYTGKTVDDLRKFMLDHNLRFAAVDSADERALYVDLYAAIDQVREIVVGKDKGRDR